MFAVQFAPLPLKALGAILPERATGGLRPDEFLSQDLFKNLPMDERVDRGGVYDVADSHNSVRFYTGQSVSNEYDSTQGTFTLYRGT